MTLSPREKREIKKVQEERARESRSEVQPVHRQ